MITRKRILLLVDGSDQSLEAIRYISSITDPDNTNLVLFHVGSGYPEVFWDMNGNPLYQTKKTKVMGWLADYQLTIGEFKEKAFKILSNAGFTNDTVTVKTQTKKTGILKDILQESYQGYSAVIVGRTGISRLKDRFTGSLAYKLVKKIRHIPTLVVAGKPISRKILIALDMSIEAMRSVTSFGSLATAKDLDITICHYIHAATHSNKEMSQTDANQNGSQQSKYLKERFRPYMDEAVQRLTEAGIEPERITCEFLIEKGNASQKLITTAVVDGYGTIVVGRSECTGHIPKYFRRHISDDIIKTVSDAAVWVVS